MGNVVSSSTLRSDQIAFTFSSRSAVARRACHRSVSSLSSGIASSCPCCIANHGLQWPGNLQPNLWTIRPASARPSVLRRSGKCLLGANPAFGSHPSTTVRCSCSVQPKAQCGQRLFYEASVRHARSVLYTSKLTGPKEMPALRQKSTMVSSWSCISRLRTFEQTQNTVVDTHLHSAIFCGCEATAMDQPSG